MEYINGETVRDKIKRGPLSAQAVLDIASQVAVGLGEADRKGIIHRDIKSAKIMVTDKGQAKIMHGRKLSNQEPDDSGNGGLYVSGVRQRPKTV